VYVGITSVAIQSFRRGSKDLHLLVDDGQYSIDTGSSVWLQISHRRKQLTIDQTMKARQTNTVMNARPHMFCSAMK
jgi:hypothetical protein